MMQFRHRHQWALLLLALVLATSLLLSACGSGQETPGSDSATAPASTPATSQEPETVDEFALVAQVADAFLAKNQAPNINPEDVYNNVVVGKDPNYFLLSIRAAEAYAKGHVEGAINIPFREIWKPENLAKLPKDKKIVVICYTGHTASQTTMLLNLLGYEAYAMKFGMMGWTSDEEVLGVSPFSGALDYPTVTEPTTAEASELPTLDTGKTDVNDIILAQAEAYLTSGKSPSINPEDVYNNVVVGKDPNYFILSIRASDAYSKGHVEGAVNIGFRDIAKPENLAKLPKNKKIVVICYTGHTASQTTMLLNLLGYDAYAMKFGMMSWTSNADVLGVTPFSGALDYPTTTN